MVNSFFLKIEKYLKDFKLSLLIKTKNKKEVKMPAKKKTKKKATKKKTKKKATKKKRR